MVKEDRYRYVILAVAFFGFMTTWMMRTSYSPIIEEIRGSLVLSYSEAGLVMSLFWIGYSLTQIPSGILSDIIGVRKLSASTLFLAGVFMYLMGNASSFIELCFYNLMAGLASGFMWCVGNSSIVRWFGSKDRTLALGMFTSASSLGVLLALVFSPLAASVFGSWRWSFWILSFPVFVSSVLALWLMRENPKDGEALSSRMPHDTFSIKEALVRIVESRAFWLLTVVMIGLKLIMGAATTWNPSYVMGVFGVAATLAGTLVSFSSLASIFSGPSAGLISDRILKRKSPVLFLSVTIVSATYFLVAVSSIWGLTVSLILIYAGSYFGSMGFGLNPSIISDLFPLRYVGTAIGFLNFTSGIGNIMGPWLFGLILDRTGAYFSSWIVFSAVTLITALFAVPLIVRELKIKSNVR